MARKLEPHPLVTGLARKLAAPPVRAAITRATTAARQAGAAGGGPLAAAPVNPIVRPPRFLNPKDLGDFGAAPDRADFIKSFDGYVGGSVEDPVNPAGSRWQVLFLDINLSSWLIVKTSDILFFDRVTDDTAAGGLRDYIWVGSDALVGSGDTTSSAAAIVRAGAFSRAGDVATSVRGDTNARRGGLLFDGMSPPCCGGKSRG